MTLRGCSWHYGVGLVFVDEEGEYPVEASPVLASHHLDFASDDQSLLVWPYFPGNRQQKTVFIRDLHDPGLSVAEPISASIDFSDGQVTACCYDVEQFGVGADEFEALDDLRATIVELYRTLKNEPQLGPLPERQLDYLNRVIRET